VSDAAGNARTIGFIGLGTMGKPIAQRLMAAGHRLVVNDVSVADTGWWEAEGARFEGSAAAVAEAARIVFLSLPGPREVEQVVTGPHGVIAAARPGDIVVDLSTNSHTMVTTLASRLAAVQVAFVDAPVSGGLAGATKGTLAVMAGGDAAVVATLAPLMACFSARVFHAGPAGMGTIAKLVNNQIFLTAATAVQEGFVMAAKAGLESSVLLEILQASSAGGYLGMAPLFFARGFDRVMFRLGLAAKDLALALETAGDLGVAMPTSRGAAEVYLDAVNKGLADKVFYATLRALEQEAGVEVAPPAARAP
jgi:3-hydroxyisobutyrate dehydrogenase-like beta-hydroxyacid dehydrogenase